MIKKPFKATQWLAANPQAENAFGTSVAAAKVSSPEFKPKPSTKQDRFSTKPSFPLGEFIVPGWTGEGLVTKNGLQVRKLIRALVGDAEEQIFEIPFENKRFANALFFEFLDFIQDPEFSESELAKNVRDGQSLWRHIAIREKSPYHDELNVFIEVFCLKSVTLYLYKLKFILNLSDQLNVELSTSNLLNPNYFIGRIFRQGSSTEIRCQALEKNYYSWFRPNPSFGEKLLNLCRFLKTLSITEMMKIFSFNHREDDFDSLYSRCREYSHSLSHRSFGLFINELLINFPRWVETDSVPQMKCYHSPIEVIRTKYTGSFMNSYCHSHWLAQENNVEKKWKEIICPDFLQEGNDRGTFLKICQEIQFISFLVEMSKKQNYDPVSLISKILLDKNSENFEMMKRQFSLFSSPMDQETEQLYERIVFHADDLPKKNPHHALIQKISEQAKNLTKGGYLYVLTSQNLFVPSHGERVHQFLKSMKVEAQFNLSDLKGKGEIPSFVYVLTKRAVMTNDQFFMPTVSEEVKECCLSFKIEGELSRFNKFNELVYEISSFLKERKLYSTPLFRGETSHGISLEFHQDAVFEGKLVSSINPDSDSVTHPNFFRNLTSSCEPLGNFFQLHPLEKKDREEFHTPLLGLNGIFKSEEQRFPAVIIVDFSDQKNVRLEIVPSSSYRAKMEQYGTAYFNYFGLIPKKSDLNLNLFREFFQSNIGRQNIHLSLNGGASKLKSKLKSLLVPKFFAQPRLADDDLIQPLSDLSLKSEEMMRLHPQELSANIINAFRAGQELASSYPWHILGLLANFRIQMDNLIKSNELRTQFHGQEHIDYRNPLILDPLVELPSFPILPDNDGLYLKFVTSDPALLNLSIEKIKIERDQDNNERLQIFHGEDALVEIYSELGYLKFIEFILNSTVGRPILNVLQAVSLPKLEEFNRIVEEFDQVNHNIEEIYSELKKTIADLFNRQIFNRN